MGIDYGMGLTNVDKETGFRYGVISQHNVNGDALNDVYTNGEDLDFQAYREEVKSRIEAALDSALDSALDDLGLSQQFNDCESMAEDIVDGLDFDGYEGTGDCTRVLYEEDGLQMQTDSTGDLWVFKSPFYTLCDYCSPCAPGAGYLTSDGDVKTYCLGHDWFEGETPYRVFRVEDDTEVTR